MLHEALRARGWTMADWQALGHDERVDLMAFEMRRQKDRAERKRKDIEGRFEQLKKNDAKWEGYVTALLTAIWADMP
jgi:uncharacterized protein YhaN